MKTLVMKFGGTSVGTGQRIREVAEIVKRFRAEETAVVVSAMSGVTNSLVDMANRVTKGLSEDEIKDFTGGIKEKHVQAVKEAVDPEFQDVPLIEIEKLTIELEKVMVGVSYVGELTPRSKDYIMSFGERLSAPIVSGALQSLGIKSRYFTGYDAGIVTDSAFGKAMPVWEITKQRVVDTLRPRMQKGRVPVITGFIGGDKEGRITTLSRGGSDFSAAILGSALDAHEIWIWTDVDGIFTTDPRYDDKARIIKVISFVEAMEMAFFGAKILHPKTIEPAMEKDIPVRVRNTFNPDNQGTLIVREQEKSNEVVKAITVLNNTALLTISGAGMIGVPGIAARVFSSLAREKVNIMMISQGSSEVNISVVIEEGDLDRAVQTLRDEFPKGDIVRDLTFNSEIAVVAVIGAGMRGTKGIAGRVFTSVARADVNVLMIAQGSSEVNISFVISSGDASRAVEALHDEFITV